MQKAFASYWQCVCRDHKCILDLGVLDVGLPMWIVSSFSSNLYEECIEGIGDNFMPCLWSQAFYWIIYYCIVLAILLLDRSFYTTILLLPKEKNASSAVLMTSIKGNLILKIGYWLALVVTRNSLWYWGYFFSPSQS